MTASHPEIPSYLKIHTAPSTPQLPPQLADVVQIDALLDAFRNATGWNLAFSEAKDSSLDVDEPVVGWSRQFKGEKGVFALSLPEQDATSTSSEAGGANAVSSAVPQSAVRPLANALIDVFEHLQEVRHTVWQREAELAAGVPVSIRPDEEEHLAERLESVLQAGAAAIQCQAAAMYLLDDATSELKLRCSWGLPHDRFLEDARPLRGSLADLEALIGHAVALEDTHLLPHWKVPENYPSAICVPISTPSTPLGTLWLFCDHPRAFNDDETAIAELIAGRVAADLEREMLIGEATKAKTGSSGMELAVRRQQDQLPNIKPMLEGWDVAGWTAPCEELNGDFFDWGILPDGQLSVSVADAQGHDLEAALTSSVLHSSLKSHGNYRHDTQQMLVRANETLWTTSLGDQFASLAYSLIDLETGTAEYSLSGDVGAVVLHAGKTEVFFDDNSLPLGADPDEQFWKRKVSLRPGDTMILVSGGVLASLCDINSPEAVRATLKTLPVSRKYDADRTLQHLKQRLDESGLDGRALDQTLLVVKRSS